jgi:hypothetical protein
MPVKLGNWTFQVARTTQAHAPHGMIISGSYHTP